MMFWLKKLLWSMGSEWAIYELEEKDPKTFKKLGQAILEGRHPIESETDQIYCNEYKKILKQKGYI